MRLEMFRKDADYAAFGRVLAASLFHLVAKFILAPFLGAGRGPDRPAGGGVGDKSR